MISVGVSFMSVDFGQGNLLIGTDVTDDGIPYVVVEPAPKSGPVGAPYEGKRPVASGSLVLRFHNTASAQVMLDALQTMMKKFAPQPQEKP